VTAALPAPPLACQHFIVDTDTRSFPVVVGASSATAPHAESDADPVAAAAPTTPGGGQPRTRTSLVASILFVAMAVLDTVEPTILVTGAWWLVLLLVWLMPWPVIDVKREHQPWFIQLAPLAVFAWLFFRANVATLDAIGTWNLFDPDDLLQRLSYPLQDAVAALLAALFLTAPLLRVFRGDAVRAAFIVATPWIILTCTGTAFDIDRWGYKPTGNSIFLFEAVFPTLLLMHACARRSSTSAADHRRHAFAASPPDGHGISRPALAIVLLLVLAVVLYRTDLTPPDSLLVTVPLLGSTYEIALAAITLLLTVAVITLLRALRGRDFRVGRMKLYDSGSEWTLAVLLLGPFWLLTVFHAAPVIGASTLETVQKVPAPAWNIDYDRATRTLSLAGAYGPGVADDFERHLATHPDIAEVELEGPGGLLGEGIAIAELIAARNLATTVKAECASACTFAFAGGTTRVVTGDGALGFHASRNPSVLLEWLEDTTEQDQFLRRRGFDAEFIADANAVPSNDIWFPTHAELRAAHVVTASR